jgi:hypothetical protein
MGDGKFYEKIPVPFTDNNVWDDAPQPVLEESGVEIVFPALKAYPSVLTLCEVEGGQE